MKEFNSESENRAIDALMAAAFRLSVPDETISEDEAMKLAANPPKLSSEDEAVVESLGPNFVENILARHEIEQKRR